MSGFKSARRPKRRSLADSGMDYMHISELKVDGKNWAKCYMTSTK